MRTGICAYLIVGLLAVTIAAAEGGPPRIEIDRTTVDLGEMKIGAVREMTFEIRNGGGSPLEISEIQSTCGCTVAELARRQIPPGEGTELLITFTAPRQREISYKYLFVLSNDPQNPKMRLSVRANVVTDLEWEPHLFKLEWPLKDGHQEEIRLTSLGGNPLQIKEVRSDKGLVIPRVATAEDREAVVTFAIDPTADFQQSDTIHIVSSSEDFPEISVPVYFRRESQLVILPQHLFFQKRIGEEAPWRYLRISRRDGEKLNVKSVQSTIDFFKCEIIENHAPTCLIKVFFTGDMTPGRYDSYLNIITDVEDVRKFVSGRCVPDEKK
jgi:hypothetical protein